MKKRTRRGDPQKQAYWEATVRRWREGGQSVRAFCRAEGLRESAFYFWRRELARRGQANRAKPVLDATSGGRPRARSAMPASRSPRHGPTPTFLPVQVVAPASRPLLRSGARHGVEIILARGHTVRVRAGFDRQTLADVLAVLEVRPC